MSSAMVLIPIRVPEFGPSLSKLTVESRRPDPIGRDAVRMRLVTKLFANAGDSRRLASQDDRTAALACLSRDAWLSLWEEATVRLSSSIADYAAAQIAEKARLVRMPGRMQRKLELTDEDRRAISGRLGASGSEFVHVLDGVENASLAVLEAPANQKGALEDWQEAQLRAARRLEQAWATVEAALDKELSYWNSAAARVGDWKKSPLPVAVFLVIGSVAAIWLGLILGGYVEAPRWFANLWAVIFPNVEAETSLPLLVVTGARLL